MKTTKWWLWVLTAASLMTLASANQAPLFSPTVSPVSGLQLTNNINSALDALNTCNSGATAPTNQLSAVPSAGNCWLDTSTTPYKWKIYDGTTWVTVAYLDQTNHYWTPVVGGGSVNSIASAATTDLCNSTNGQPAYVSITGVVGITSFGSSCTTGQVKVVAFAGALTITHNAASMILPNNAANVTTAAGDTAIAVYLGGGNWRVVSYVLASGAALNSGGSVTLVGDAAYGILTTDNIVATNAALSTPRTWTLPAANAVAASKAIEVCDRANAVTPPNVLTIARAGADTIVYGPGTVTSIVMAQTSACIKLESDGTSKWLVPSVSNAGRVLLNTLTAAASASLSDTTSFTSTYSSYEIIFENLLPATNATTLRLRINSAGVKTANYFASGVAYSPGGAGGITQQTAFIALTNIGAASNDTSVISGASGNIFVSDLSSTTKKKWWRGKVAYRGTAANQEAAEVMGYWDGGTGAITGIEISFSAGNITSGTAKIYGIP